MDYQVRVRGKSYLWGGHDIVEEIRGDLIPVFLSIRNDDSGETVAIGKEERQADNSIKQTLFGDLARGQTYTFHLLNVAGIYAEQKDGLPTTITCEIHGR